MPESHYLDQLQRRLVELGCPAKRMRQMVREVADHREDLKQAALAEGLLEAGAETRAEVQLGDPRGLAKQLMVALQRSSWWGRHFVVGFCLLPLLAFPVLRVAGLLLAALLEFMLIHGWNSNQLQTAVSNPVTFHQLNIAFQLMDDVTIALVALLFCWLACRSAVNRKWMLISCIICSIYSLTTWAKVTPHALTVFAAGFNLNLGNLLKLHWLRGVIPLLVAFAFYVFQRQSARASYEKVALWP